MAVAGAMPRKRSTQGFTGHLVVGGLVGLAFITASFDVVGSVRVGGATVRFFNLLQIVLVSVAALTLLGRDRIPVSLARYFGAVLGAGLCFCAIDAYSAVAWAVEGGKGIGYSAWFALNVSFVSAGILIGAFGLGPAAILNLYMVSFLTAAGIALVQLVLGLGGVDFFTAQWIVDQRVPRLNGFSYEPSYFSTYMLTGFVLSSELWYRLPKGQASLVRVTSIVTGLMILLSTSRMGILCAVAYAAGRLALIQFDRGASVIQKLAGALSAAVFVASLAVLAVLVAMSDELFFYVFNGLGLDGTADHSVSERSTLMRATYDVFASSPLFGVGTGNVGVYADGFRGDAMAGRRAAEQLTGLNITLETLAGMGVFGFAAIVLFVVFVFNRLSAILTKSHVERHIFNALLLSFLSLIAILQLNQNILRAYLWTHLFVVTSYAGHLVVRQWSGKRTVLFTKRRRLRLKKAWMVPSRRFAGSVSGLAAPVADEQKPEMVP